MEIDETWVHNNPIEGAYVEIYWCRYHNWERFKSIFKLKN